MATKIITKTGSGAPTTSDVDRGELAVDLTNKQLYTNDGSSIIKLGSGAGEGQWSLATNGDDIYYNEGNVGIGGVADTFGAGIATLQLNGTSTGSPTQAGALRFRSQNGTSSQCDIYSDNGYMSFYTGNSTTSTERMRIEANGNVGITSTDTVALTATGGVNGYVRVNAPTGQAAFSLGVGGTQKGVISYDNTDDMKITSDTTMRFVTNLTERMRIDADGRVGINGDPGTRTAADYIDQAKAKIKTWNAAIKTKLDEEPKANKKAVTLEVTDDAFEVIPTEDLVAEWMAGRAIGGGNAKLQVDGAGYFNHTVIDNGAVWNSYSNATGLSFSNTGTVPTDNTGAISNGVADLGRSASRFKNGYFSGTVDANAFTVNGSPLTRTSDLIETLSTLREATQDETTLEGLRDSIGNAIGGLIEKFEAKVIQGSS